MGWHISLYCFELSELIIPDTFGWFNLSYAVAMLSAGVGLLLLLRGVFKKDNILFKKAIFRNKKRLYNHRGYLNFTEKETKKFIINLCD